MLNAASGSLDVMRTEYKASPGFDAWYKRAVAPRLRRGGDLDWFIRQRNRVQHRSTLTLRPEEEEVGFMPTQHPNPRRPRFRAPVQQSGSHLVQPGAQVRHYRHRWYFAARPSADAWTVCDDHLAKINAIVEECHARFG